jgi:hypothetical protein
MAIGIVKVFERTRFVNSTILQKLYRVEEHISLAHRLKKQLEPTIVVDSLEKSGNRSVSVSSSRRCLSPTWLNSDVYLGISTQTQALPLLSSLE